MAHATDRIFARVFTTLAALALSASLHAAPATGPIVADTPPALEAIAVPALAPSLRVGDVVFIRIDAKPFREVAQATRSWTNHVGVVVDTSGTEPLIAESKFPFSRTTLLSAFVARSEGGRVAVSRLHAPLSAEQERAIALAAEQRVGVFYDTGFNLHSPRQFCSRYVREVLAEATGIHVGEVETFETLFANNPQANLGFWRLWYFGRIPWSRETVTPESVRRSTALVAVFDGIATPDPAR
jgi:Permuted papain-like amidase enzyme, YaeF/YiiX, C92 family